MKLLEYLRKSRAEEGLDTDEVLQKHSEALTELAAKRGDQIVEVYKEVVSGESLYARPEMLRLLRDVEEGKGDGVLCMDLDRLSRGRMTDQGHILDALKWSGTVIVTPDKVYDLNEETDELTAEFKTFISRQEYKQINKRLRRGLMRSINDGCYTSNAPYGYKRVTIDRKPTLEIVPEEAEIVKTMFSLYAGGMGCQSIATWANDSGAKPRRSDQFTRTAIRCILKDPAYCGKVVWNRLSHVRKGARGNDKHITIYNPEEKWLVVDGLHQAIVTKEQFDRVQQIFKDKYIPSRQDGSIKSPLAGLIKCAHCGNNMQRIPYSKRGDPYKDYLICMRKGCMKSTPYDYVEEAVLNGLKKEMLKLRAAADTGTDTEALKCEKLLAAAKRKHSEQQKVKEKLYDLLESGVYTPAVFNERMEASISKSREAEIQTEEIEDKLERLRGENKREKADRIETVLERYSAGDAGEKNALLHSVVKQITYSKEKDAIGHDLDLDIELK